jgi:hypothetical protein
MQTPSDFVDEFAAALKRQLQEDHARWGDTWLHRTRAGQELRVEQTLLGYFDQFKYASQPVPWVKVAGNALICWIREQHPELFPERGSSEPPQ